MNDSSPGDLAERLRQMDDQDRCFGSVNDIA